MEDCETPARLSSIIDPLSSRPAHGSGSGDDDGPPFELTADNSDHGPEYIDCETAEDLECWLGDLREADHY